MSTSCYRCLQILCCTNPARIEVTRPKDPRPEPPFLIIVAKSLAFEARHEGFCLAPYPSKSLPIDHRACRPKKDVIDIEMLLRIDSVASG